MQARSLLAVRDLLLIPALVVFYSLNKLRFWLISRFPVQ